MSRRRAFTRGEIILAIANVVAIAFLLAYNWWNNNHWDIEYAYNPNKAARAQLTLLVGAVETYRLDEGRLPSSLSALIVAPDPLPNPQKWTGPYLDKVELPTDPWNQPFHYQKLSESQFRIWSSGRDEISGSSDDIATKQN